eukprot:gene3592-3857_t
MHSQTKSCPSISRLLVGAASAKEAGVQVVMANRMADAKVPSQAFLSPFSPVFDLELDSKRVNSCSSGMDRCLSEQQLADNGFARPPTLLQQILQLCRCTTPVAAQVRDGAQQQEKTKNPRSCLQNLRHRYIVCLGWRSRADAEPDYLPEPLVVEPRFREQFAIAHPTHEYEALLQSVPPCFVGPAPHLEAVVKLLCEQMVVAFKSQGLPVPPWRSRQALLSKWSPTQLAELAAKIANLRRLSMDLTSMHAGSAHAECMTHQCTHEQLRNGNRPAAVAQQAAVGSAPEPAGDAASTCAAVAAWTGANHHAQPLTQEHLALILPNDMKQQLYQQAGTSSIMSAMASAAAHPAMVAGGRHAPGGYEGSTACGIAANSKVAPLSLVSVAAEGAPLACRPALPAGPAGGPAPLSGRAPRGPAGVSPAATDVMALLEAAEGLHGNASGNSTLKFTRKASAEWKHQRSNSHKMKGLLAAALKKPTAVPARAGLPGGVEAAVMSRVYPQLTAGGNSCSAAAAAGAAAAASNARGAGGESSVSRELSSSDGLIRRTHYRPTGDEPWRCITTVRLGAYAPTGGAGAAAAAVAAAGRSQLAGPMQPAQQTPRPLATS